MHRVDRLIQMVIFLARMGAGLAFAILISAVLIQVVGRLTGNAAVWTEELTRFAMLFLIAFGAGLAFRSGDLVNVDVICESLPGRLPWLLRLLSAIATAGLALYLIAPAWHYVSIGRMQTSPALGLRMDLVHLTVLLLLAGLALFSVLRILGMLSGAEDGKTQKPQED